MSSTKKLINLASNVVPESLEGVLLTNSNLAQVADLNVLVRKDINVYKKSHVTIISGGGSGHEPAHGGFIGDGMLSGAVCGNVFASPSVSMILAAIRTCTGPHGTLLIIKNYTGDRLNFGMAMEKAKAEGLKVTMCIVADDCALPEGKGITGGRGVAGTVFVHKISGAAAHSGKTLEEVTSLAQEAANSLGSLGVALTTCTVPGAPPSTRLSEPNKYEVGLGIHGEPGRETHYFVEGATNNADNVADTLVDLVLQRMNLGASLDGVVTSIFSSPTPVAILLNNLGSLPAIEVYIVARRVVQKLRSRGLAPVRVFVGPFMTALDMAGCSLTLFKVTESQVAALDAHTTAPGWLPATPLPLSGELTASIAYVPEAFQKEICGGNACTGASTLASKIAQRIIESESELTRCDAICGDGDCGIVMKAGASKVLIMCSSELRAAESDSALFCDRLANGFSASMGGTSGALLELFFRAMANSLAACPESWASAFKAGVDAMMFYGGATVGMRTLLDALVPAVEALQANSDAATLSRTAATAAEKGTESTKFMGSLAGRSNYVNEEGMRGVPDPGALAVSLAFAEAADFFQTN